MAVSGPRAPAVFIDKDGTLLEDVPYNVQPCRIRFTPGAIGALRLLDAAGYRVVIVTNQSGVARGLFGERELGAVRRHIEEVVRAAGVAPPAFYYCPHHPEGAVPAYAVGCPCRKPQPGMLLAAAAALSLDLRRSWMVGDILDDVEAGRSAGCRTVL
ncbi:MAG TPA: HAD-IIIA family hydrolase, partial [Dehalococcoidia bacterium]|nr:HAD-IIIA family hydrolase [Dehalococcoidia bacterium]